MEKQFAEIVKPIFSIRNTESSNCLYLNKLKFIETNTTTVRTSITTQNIGLNNSKDGIYQSYLMKKSLILIKGRTYKKENNHLVTNGGRVAMVSAYGKDIEEALLNANATAHAISFDNMYFRKDIGYEFISDNSVSS